MKFVADKPGQVVVRVTGPQASGKSMLVRRTCEYLQSIDVSYHHEEEGEEWASFDPKRVPAMYFGRRPIGFRDEEVYKASRANAKYLFIVEQGK